MTMAAIGSGLNLVVPTIQAGLQIAAFLKSSADLWQAGVLTEGQLRDMWHSAGVSVVAADANLREAMEAADKRVADK